MLRGVTDAAESKTVTIVSCTDAVASGQMLNGVLVVLKQTLRQCRLLC